MSASTAQVLTLFFISVACLSVGIQDDMFKRALKALTADHVICCAGLEEMVLRRSWQFQQGAPGDTGQGMAPSRMLQFLRGPKEKPAISMRNRNFSEKRRRNGTTAFQEDVYKLVRTVPRGKVTTYGAVAAALGRGSARSVGAAMRNNPYGSECMP
eukprot:gnl/MRDRNA2_/MRDRNA2_71049_c0_seq1.p1 gnl/MRDRNA2_/MRDRNA2_71049_c0~~gnl/MRDRNA2_/MRDRNA2_71049_c0_seq1.p1  ORF type:complete len:156 (+),score=14.60 gnl/MRDRNA2_/MRDRNA2_71049_c0_seq1:118-585(+)